MPFDGYNTNTQLCSRLRLSKLLRSQFSNFSPCLCANWPPYLMNLVAIAVVLRVDYENKLLMRGGRA